MKEPDRWIAYPTIEQADKMFSAVKNNLGISSESKKGRKRRIDELNWRTVARDIHEHAKRPREEEEEGSGNE